MLIFYPTSHYDKNYRGQVFPLLKPFIKGKGFTDKDRKAMYGVTEVDYTLVNQIADAEVVILTMSWNYYVTTKQLEMAIDLIKKAAEENKTVWSYNAGDFGVKIPSFPNLKVFRFGGYASREQNGHRGMPVMLKDRLKQYYSLNTYSEKTYTKQPVVGFCGQANDSILTATKEIARTLLRNTKSKLGLRREESQVVMSTSKLRADLLGQLEKASSIQDNFIKRKKYRAGVLKNKEQHQTMQEFYDNILSSDYVLCVRGAGNFSVRFYETLMMGRIPLYVHTDGFLPLNNTIDWKEHVVWVDAHEINQIDKKVLDFHKKLNQNELQEIFRKNRKLWEEKLRLDGFFKSEFKLQQD